jgi:hypothetical protein
MRARAVIRVAILVAIAFSSTGCMCTRAVRNCGRQEVNVCLQTAMIDDDGNILIDTICLQWPWYSRKLGHRYIYASAETIAESIAKYPRSISRDETKNPRVVLRPDLTLKVPNWEHPEKGWFLYPVDLRSNIVDAPEPPVLETGRWRVCGKIDWTELAFPYRLHGQVYTLVIWDNDESNYHYRKWWGYPCQVMLVPAAAIDIVTFPLQAYLFLRDWRGPFG